MSHRQSLENECLQWGANNEKGSVYKLSQVFMLQVFLLEPFQAMLNKQKFKTSLEKLFS